MVNAVHRGTQTVGSSSPLPPPPPTGSGPGGNAAFQVDTRPELPERLVKEVTNAVLGKTKTVSKHQAQEAVREVLYALQGGQANIDPEAFLKPGRLPGSRLNQRALDALVMSISLDLNSRSSNDRVSTDARQRIDRLKTQPTHFTVRPAVGKSGVDHTFSNLLGWVHGAIQPIMDRASLETSYGAPDFVPANTRYDNPSFLQAMTYTQTEDEKSRATAFWQTEILARKGLNGQTDKAFEEASKQENVKSARKLKVNAAPSQYQNEVNNALNNDVRTAFRRILGDSRIEDNNFEIPAHGLHLAHNTMSYVQDRLPEVADAATRSRIEGQSYFDVDAIARGAHGASQLQARMAIRDGLRSIVNEQTGAFKQDETSRQQLKSATTLVSKERAMAEAHVKLLTEDFRSNLEKFSEAHGKPMNRRAEELLKRHIDHAKSEMNAWRELEKQLEAGANGKKAGLLAIDNSSDKKQLTRLRGQLDKHLHSLLGLAAEIAILQGDKGQKLEKNPNSYNAKIDDLIKNRGAWSVQDLVTYMLYLMGMAQDEEVVDNLFQMNDYRKEHSKKQFEATRLQNEHAAVHAQWTKAYSKERELVQDLAEAQAAAAGNAPGTPAHEDAQNNIARLTQVVAQQKTYVGNLDSDRNDLMAAAGDADGSSKTWETKVEFKKAMIEKGSNMKKLFMELAADLQRQFHQTVISIMRG
jgi:hypothetical protein